MHVVEAARFAVPFGSQRGQDNTMFVVRNYVVDLDPESASGVLPPSGNNCLILEHFMASPCRAYTGI